MDVLTESHKAAERLYYRVARKTLKAASASLLREFVTSQIVEKREKVSQIPNVVLSQKDLNQIYDDAAAIGLGWIKELLDRSDDDDDEVTATYVKAIRMAVEKREFFNLFLLDGEKKDVRNSNNIFNNTSMYKAEDVGASDEVIDSKDGNHLNLNSNEVSRVEQLRMRQVIDPCCLRSSIWKNKQTQTPSFGEPSPKIAHPYTQDRRISKEMQAQWTKLQIQKLDAQARRGSTRWLGKGANGWNAIVDECSRVNARAHDYSNFAKQREELEIIPRQLVDDSKAKAGDDKGLSNLSIGTGTEGNIDALSLPSWKLPIFSSNAKRELNQKRKRSIKETVKPITEKDRLPLDLVINGRSPSSLGEARWAMNDVKRHVEQWFNPHDERLLSHVLHSLEDTQTSKAVHSIQGAAKPVGEIHVWEQNKAGDEYISVTRKVIRERVGVNGTPYTFNNSRKSRILRTETKENETFEIDMGSCLLELFDEKTQSKNIYAFRSLELSLEIRPAFKDTSNYLKVNV